MRIDHWTKLGLVEWIFLPCHVVRCTMTTKAVLFYSIRVVTANHWDRFTDASGWDIREVNVTVDWKSWSILKNKWRFTGVWGFTGDVGAKTMQMMSMESTMFRTRLFFMVRFITLCSENTKYRAQQTGWRGRGQLTLSGPTSGYDTVARKQLETTPTSVEQTKKTIKGKAMQKLLKLMNIYIYINLAYKWSVRTFFFIKYW